MFLAFVQCLKEDAKYSELVSMMEAILTEFDHTATALTADGTVSTSHNTQTEKNAVWSPSLTAAG